MGITFRYFLEDSAFAGPGAVVTPLAVVALLLIVLDVIDRFRGT